MPCAYVALFIAVLLAGSTVAAAVLFFAQIPEATVTPTDEKAMFGLVCSIAILVAISLMSELCSFFRQTRAWVTLNLCCNMITAACAIFTTARWWSTIIPESRLYWAQVGMLAAISLLALLQTFCAAISACWRKRRESLRSLECPPKIHSCETVYEVTEVASKF